MTTTDYLSEQRTIPSGLILREEGGEAIIEGRVVPFGEWSEVDNVREGRFLERFLPGSLTKTFRKFRQLKVYFEHGRSQLFERLPIAELRRVWEQPDGAYFTAALVNGLPETLLDGLRRGLYGASVGARPVKTSRNRPTTISGHNPDRLEERSYVELEAHEISITPSPHYLTATVSLRSDALADEGLLLLPRGKPCAARRDYLADEPHDYLAHDHPAPAGDWRL